MFRVRPFALVLACIAMAVSISGCRNGDISTTLSVVDKPASKKTAGSYWSKRKKKKTAGRYVVNKGETWAFYAEKYLWNRAKGRPFDASRDRVPTCLRMNNYGCLKHRVSKPYRGTPNRKGVDGAHDGVHGGKMGHAVFAHPKYSVAASFYWFERSFKVLNLRTARQLSERYAPWCDTQGSKATRKERGGKRRWGRTCKGGNRVSRRFRGPKYKKPYWGTPSKAQCSACNCPTSFVKSWLKGTNIGPDDELNLFDKQGKPTRLMQTIITGHTPWEIGYRPREELVRAGAAVFEPRYSRME